MTLPLDGLIPLKFRGLTKNADFITSCFQSITFSGVDEPFKILNKFASTSKNLERGE